jgi:hypothetical protein
MLLRTHCALFAIMAALVAGCTPTAEQQAAEVFTRDQLFCKANPEQACVRYLDSKCLANLDLCKDVRSNQSQLLSDLKARCDGGERAACLVLESYRCDSGDEAECVSSAARYNRSSANCKAGDESACATLAESAWPNRMIATAEKSCDDGDQIACRVANAAHQPASGLVVDVPTDYHP